MVEVSLWVEIFVKGERILLLMQIKDFSIECLAQSNIDAKIHELQSIPEKSPDILMAYLCRDMTHLGVSNKRCEIQMCPQAYICKEAHDVMN